MLSQYKFDTKNLHKGKIFFGKKLLNNEVSNLYLDIHDFQRITVVGTSGGGKSNITNVFLLNILFNIDLVDRVVFYDGKGGIEAQPLLEIAKEYNLDLKVCTTFNQLEKELLEVEDINLQRQEYIKSKSQKKYDDKIIYVIFDEFAILGLARALDKEQKEQLARIMSIYSIIHSQGRSQRIYSCTICQSFLQNASGIPSDVKTNISTKLMFRTDNKESIQSVFSADVLEDNRLNPKELEIGQFILSHKNSIYKCRSVLVDEDIKPLFRQAIEMSHEKENITYSYSFKEQLSYKSIIFNFEYLDNPEFNWKRYKRLSYFKKFKYIEAVPMMLKYKPKIISLNYLFSSIVSLLIDLILAIVLMMIIFLVIIIFQ